MAKRKKNDEILNELRRMRQAMEDHNNHTLVIENKVNWLYAKIGVVMIVLSTIVAPIGGVIYNTLIKFIGG